MYAFPTRSCEWLDLVRCGLRADTKSGASCEKSQSQLIAKIEINAVFLKCLCGDPCYVFSNLDYGETSHRRSFPAVIRDTAII